MTEEAKPQSNTVAIARYFGINGKDAMDQLKQLSDDEKQQLGDGIRNGSLTY